MPLKLNSTGGGSVTLDVPSTGSTYTVTIPASTGTMVTTSGGQTVEFAAGTASAPSITTTGDTNNGIYFPAADTVSIATNGTERVKVDSSGRVTIPSQPIFMGYPTNDYSSGGMPTGVIAFTVTYNNGSYYSAATSRFTAPIAGWYRTTWGGLQLSSTVTSLQVNGSDVNNGNHFATGTAGAPTYINMTQTAIRYLNANDYLTIRGWNGGGYFAAWYLWTVDLIA